MLVLTRRRGEIIVIRSGEHTIEVRVTGIALGQVRLAIDAPQEVTIVRKEISHIPCRRKEQAACAH